MMGVMGNLFLWLIYLPILTLLKCLFFFFPKVQSRLEFEHKNKTEAGSRSFRREGIKADLCFEFSSEGEYQQVASLIEDALLMGKKLELVFFSPSVEKTILELFQRFPNQIRYLRYPILSLSFSSWISSSTLILVRYDLFPEFLIWAMKRGRRLKFVWVTFKKERVSRKSVSLFKRAFITRSDFTVFATEADYELGKQFGANGVVYDFRMEQIKRRIDLRFNKFEKVFPQYPELKNLMEPFPRNKRLILGNAWPVDLGLLKNLPADIFLVIVPHQLKPEIIDEMMASLTSLDRTPAILSDQSEFVAQGQTILVNKKGILCELYADFGKAYVGGGFGVSVHSLLEPLVAGCENLSCGPVNHRSTEFDLAQSYGCLTEVKTPQDFDHWLAEDISKLRLHDKLKSQVAAYPKFQKEILSC